MKWILAPLVFLMVGCASQTVYVQGDLTGPPDYEDVQSFWLFGLGQESVVDATQICSTKKGGHISQVRVRQTFVNALVNVVTLGIYAPRTVQVACK